MLENVNADDAVPKKCLKTNARISDKRQIKQNDYFF